ncbi:MAG: hypothetical protein ACERKD_04410 [Prolixibacteraceae bacterium]
MKKILIFSLVIFQGIQCFSQNIVVEDRIWSEALFASEGNTVQTTHHTFINDTIIQDKLYKHAMLTWSSSYSNWLSYHDFVREDSGKVYILNDVLHIEQILYDFTLQIGDEFFERYLVNPYTVDSIAYKEIQGESLKHIYLSDEGHGIMLWIEKYGSYKGVLAPYPIIGGGFSLLCVHEQGNLVYQNEKYNTCSLNGTYTANNEIAIDELVLSSVGGNTVAVRNNENSKGVLSFFTIDGKEVLRKAITNKASELCLPNSGIFIYRFLGENGEIQTGKIVVN